MKDPVSLIRTHMETLCEKIGARPTGSVNNKKATDYASEVLGKCGFDVQEQKFECIDWMNCGAKLTIDGNAVPAEPAEYSLPCDLESEFVCIDTVEKLKNTDLSGKMAVLYGELCKEELMPKNFTFYNPDEHKLIISLLEKKAPGAVITAGHMIRDGDFGVPCAFVSEDVLNVFLHSSVQRAVLTISTERIPSKAVNVIASYGTGEKRICFSAHIDTKPTAPGALDNASGTSVLLTLAYIMCLKKCNVRTDIVLFNGEDHYSMPGETAYMASLEPEYALAVNVDGVGLKGSGTSVSFYQCPKELEDRIMNCAKTEKHMIRTEPWPMGDHMIFAYAAYLRSP